MAFYVIRLSGETLTTDTSASLSIETVETRNNRSTCHFYEKRLFVK